MICKFQWSVLSLVWCESPKHNKIAKNRGQETLKIQKKRITCEDREYAEALCTICVNIKNVSSLWDQYFAS